MPIPQNHGGSKQHIKRQQNNKSKLFEKQVIKQSKSDIEGYVIQ